MEESSKNLLSNFIFVGSFEKLENSINLIKFNFNCTNEIKKDIRGRVYVFVEENNNGSYKILKIGKSNDKNGMSGTIGFYSNALSGTPSQSRYCLHYLIYQKLNEGKKIKAYVVFNDSTQQTIKGFITEKNIYIPPDMTYVEKIYLDDYKKINGKYPDWNFQENSEEHDYLLMENFGKFIQNKKNKK